jgi:hypothetical protein
MCGGYFLTNGPSRTRHVNSIILSEAPQSAGAVSARMQARLCFEHGKRLFLVRSLVLHEEWARRYAERLGATVVESVDDVVGILDELLNPPVQLSLTYAPPMAIAGDVRALTDPYLATFTPVPPAADGVCDVCHGAPNPGWLRCLNCKRTISQVSRPLTRIVPLTLRARMGPVHYLLRSTRTAQSTSGAD